MAANHATQAIASGDLTDLVSASAQATIYPSDDAILAVLQARFRADLPYSRIGSSNLVAVNPYKSLANVNDASAREYEERCYRDTSLPMVDSPRPLQPHLYDLAARTYLLMRRRRESQTVISRGITGSGKSSSLRLLLGQILRLSTHSKREKRIAEQIQALGTVLDSFGNAKTLMNPNASRHGRYLELHFNDKGKINSAKVLTYGLDKFRLSKLSHEERTYHVFYQLLAGVTPQERDALMLEDASDYALLASSGCYRLPSGPFSDDSIAMDDLRAAMRTLGFKQKHMTSIFSLLVAILLLGNIQFADPDAKDVAAYIANPQVIDHAARLLGVSSDDLSQVLTTKTSYVRKELYTVLLNAEQAAGQRDHCVRDLYAILFAFIVETANHRLAPGPKDPPPPTQIILLDQPGFQTRGPSGTTSVALSGTAPLIAAYGQNGFEEFCVNFNDELLHSYIIRHSFENIGYNGQIASDGITLPNISTMDNGACVELLRGAQLSEKSQRKPGGLLGVMNKACSSYKSGKSNEHRDENLLQEMGSKFGVHASYAASPSVGGAQDRFLFGINHYAGSASYDIRGFIERDSDLLDSAYVTLLRGSNDAFVSKLLSGPSLAAEKHNKDENIIVQAQVSSRPLRQPTPILSPDGTFPTDDHGRLDPTKTYPVTAQLNFTTSEIFASIDKTHLWTISCIRPNDSSSPNSFDKRRVKNQIRALLLPDLVARKSVEYVVDYELGAFCDRYVPRMRGSCEERITQCVRSNGWKEGLDYVVGHRCIWLSYSAWKVVEDQVRAAEKEQQGGKTSGEIEEEDVGDDFGTDYTHPEGGIGLGGGTQSLYYGGVSESADNLLNVNNTGGYGGSGLATPNLSKGYGGSPGGTGGGGWSDWDHKSPSLLGGSPGNNPPPFNSPGMLAKEMVVKEAPNAVEEVPTTRTRRIWLWIVTLCTFWIPNFLLKWMGRMKRPDVQIAWREKITIFWLIFLLNGIVVFYIVEFGRLLCPSFDKAWSIEELGGHQGSNDYYVAVQGVVYDVTHFVGGDHSDIPVIHSNTPDVLDSLGGQDLTAYFPVPLTLGCPGLVADPNMVLTVKNTSVVVQPLAVHKSGGMGGGESQALKANDWYTARFLPRMKEFRKGALVWDWKHIQGYAKDQDIQKIWAVWNNGLYDLTDYVNTIAANSGAAQFQFLDKSVSDVFRQQAGQDVTKPLTKALDALDPTKRAQTVNCLKNVFYAGETDFRKTPRCQVQNYFLLIASGILMSSMGLKFLAALQLGSKRNPENQDKFVLCQVPCYTEGEDSLRRTIDSLAGLDYDDKRKLIFIICDGNIIGSGNDRTTPRIVLDILGVDPKLDPEPLMFKSVGEGSRAINYGKIYSGLYEFEGHVVPYMVVVKVGKPTERSKPGNRGKRDSQILLMHYLNRVHFDAPMSPLELEIYHQMRNVIGIDPAFYEYIFTVDADTTVTPGSLNRLVASCADDSSIIGICGETKLENEEGSWWTMIQVYEYYISHHLSKAFESLFGSVTCLPGCFSLYRIRTADKGRPVIISNRIIDEYAEPNVDTLHKKNLFSLGEDRFLTTLLMKHFPTFKTKFCPDAVAHTMAPESWRVLFSQRRRWINSTVHNLCELVLLPELFGFCCFSMRFFVFIDLLSTLILPATVVYLLYLIITVATRAAAFPRIAIIMLAVVYGLQAIIFILKREFMLVGWMVVYIASYPVYSFFLPVYSFWCMDEFSWGNTRVVVGEGKEKKVLMSEEEKFDESMIPLKKFSEYEAEAWETGTRHSDETGYDSKPHSRYGGGGVAQSEESRHTYHQASHAGDYYRDTNLTYNNSSNPNLRLGPRSQASHSNLSHQSGMATGQPMSQFGGGGMAPQLPFMPFGGGPPSAAGSDYGGAAAMSMMPTLGYQGTGSMYGMPMGMPMGMMGGGGSGSVHGSQIGGYGGGAPQQMNPFATPGMQRPTSTFSFATSVNPFAGPSMSENPTDEELFQALRNYLSTQDLMSVTKKTAREAMASRFPKADLSSRKDFLNQSIDRILSES